MLRRYFVLASIVCLWISGALAQELVTAVSADAPGSFSPPIKGAVQVSGEFTVSGMGADVDNNAVTERTIIRMTVKISDAAGVCVRTLAAESSASSRVQ